MTDFNFTANEAAAVKALYRACLAEMGGSSIESLEADPFTWVNIDDLVGAGWTKPAAKGTFSALLDKGALDDNGGEGVCLTMEAARWAAAQQ